jgi:dipeptidyl aminopeptidase/acylaminoacyl peptidase
MAMTHGMMFISPDYRLLHPSTSFDQMADVKALSRFLSTDVKTRLPENTTLDVSRIAVAGVSAGGYLARLTALYMEPRPRAVLSISGMGGDWFSDHHLALKMTPIEYVGHMISQKDVAHLENSEPVAEVFVAPDTTTGQFKDRNGRVNLFPWWWQNGDFIDHLIGETGLSERLRHLPSAEREAAVPADVAKLFPQLNIDSTFPPTILIHGHKDSTVLVSESEYTHSQFQKAGIRSILHIVPDADHDLRMPPERKLASQAKDLYKQAFEFLCKEIA